VEKVSEGEKQELLIASIVELPKNNAMQCALRGMGGLLGGKGEELKGKKPARKKRDRDVVKWGRG